MNDQVEPNGECPPQSHTGQSIQARIDAYVDQFKTAGDLFAAIQSAAVERAFRRVPRHCFIESYFIQRGTEWVEIAADPTQPDPQALEIIYSEEALVTRFCSGIPSSSSSQPGLVAHMLELLRLQPGMRVLEIGTGTGYNAALLAEIVGDPALVTTVDIQADVVAQAERAFARAGCAGIRVLCRDGYYAVPEAAPYDRIIVTVGCPDLSPHWVAQLAPAGFVLVPFRHGGANPLLEVWNDAGAVVGKMVSSCGFMPMQGVLRDPAYFGPGGTAPNRPPERFPLWPELHTDAPGGLGWAHRTGFWFYLGSRDRRTFTRSAGGARGFGLADPERGAIAVEHKEIVLQGDRTLHDTLIALYDDWRQLGMPRSGNYRLHFVPREAPHHAWTSSAAWSLDGKCYRRVFTLEQGP
jgi:protein-L-isoaspartate(D-aspartate) O-methyltransferase